MELRLFRRLYGHVRWTAANFLIKWTLERYIGGVSSHHITGEITLEGCNQLDSPTPLFMGSLRPTLTFNPRFVGSRLRGAFRFLEMLQIVSDTRSVSIANTVE